MDSSAIFCRREMQAGRQSGRQLPIADLNSEACTHVYIQSMSTLILTAEATFDIVIILNSVQVKFLFLISE